jgi:7-cyano-7-deazaguanine synthase in queuosine biosynthesis
MAKDLAIVLNNGSVNSAVITALATQKYRTILLFAEVGDQTGVRSRAAYDLQVAHFKPYREHTLPMPFLSLIQPSRDNTSGLSDPRHPTPIAPQMVDLLPLVSAAMRFAVHYQAAAVYLGLRVGGSPDELAQATEYIQIWNEIMQLPCNQPDLMIETPLLEVEPWQVVDIGVNVAAPFDRTWSCVEASSEPCWACRGCRSREAAFQQAGKPDPLRVVRKI